MPASLFTHVDFSSCHEYRHLSSCTEPHAIAAAQRKDLREAIKKHGLDLPALMEETCLPKWTIERRLGEMGHMIEHEVATANRLASRVELRESSIAAIAAALKIHGELSVKDLVQHSGVTLSMCWNVLYNERSLFKVRRVIRQNRHQTCFWSLIPSGERSGEAKGQTRKPIYKTPGKARAKAVAAEGSAVR